MNDKSNYLCDICRVIIRLKNDNINPGIISGTVKIEEVNKPDEKQINDYEVPVSPKWDTVDIYILVGSVSGFFLLVGIIGFIYDTRKINKIYGDLIHENR